MLETLLSAVCPVTVKLLMLEVARVELPLTLSVPPTVSKLLIVVEPVTAKVLEAEFQVKLPLLPVLVAAV